MYDDEINHGSGYLVQLVVLVSCCSKFHFFPLRGWRCFSGATATTGTAETGEAEVATVAVTAATASTTGVPALAG